MFGPGSKSEVVEDMAEVVGELGAARGGGSRSSSEPDVCRALTGVAKGALPERGFISGSSIGNSLSHGPSLRTAR